MRVLAIDPGERVGWATVEYNGGDLPSFELRTHGISFLKDFALKLGLSFADYDVVVYETFRLTSKGARVMVGSDLQTAQLIGIIRYLSWIHPQVKLASQGPSVKATAEKTMPDDIRSIIDKLPKSHDESHDGDAIMHAWHWYWTRYI